MESPYPSAADRTIDADGIVLRPPVESDAEAIAAGCGDPITQRWITMLVSPYTSKDALNWINETVPADWERGGGTWVADLDGIAVGAFSVHTPRHGVASAGYWVNPRVRGQKVATRALRAMADWAFNRATEPIHRLELMIEPVNEGSQRVALAGGFRFEALRAGAAPQRDGSRSDYGCWIRLADDPPGPTALPIPDLPAEGLTDGVIRLRRPELADAPARLESALDPESRRWLIGASAPPTLESMSARLGRTAFNLFSRNQIDTTVVEVESGAVVGSCGTWLESAAVGMATLGYEIHPAYRGRGYAGRAARLLSEWVLTQPAVHRIEIGAAVENTASRRVLEKAGFTYEGVLHSYLPGATGERHDLALFSVVKPSP